MATRPELLKPLNGTLKITKAVTKAVYVVTKGQIEATDGF
jgi:formylmethanofuran dehydrogenase subunit A